MADDNVSKKRATLYKIYVQRMSELQDQVTSDLTSVGHLNDETVKLAQDLTLIRDHFGTIIAEYAKVFGRR